MHPMLRRALLFSVALAGILGSTDASAAQTTIPVRGDVEAIALAGDAVIVARQPIGRGFTLERIVPGAGVQTLLRLARSNDRTEAALAATAQGLALGVQTDANDGFSASRVYVGPPAGPLRDVAACAAGLLLPPVAVAGSQIAWREGGCGEPEGGPRAIGPVAIVIGGPDATTPLRRIAVGPDELPATIVLDGATGFTGVLRPSFFSVDSEVRRLGPSALGETLLIEQGRVVAPVGVLGSGEGVFLLGPLEGDDSGSATVCDTTLFVLTPGSSDRRKLSLGGCPIGSGYLSGATRVAGDRVYSLIAEPRRARSTAPSSVAFVSTRSDGGDARVFVRGTRRAPRGIAADAAGRVAWWQRRCAGGTEVVTDDGATPAAAKSTPSCSLTVLNRSARVRRGAITLRLRCPLGCSGQVIADTRLPRFLRSFSFARGTHSLRLSLSRGERRRQRLQLGFEIADGRSRTATIRLR